MSAADGRLEQIRRLYETFISGDLEALEPDLHPQIEFVNPADAVEPGTRFGPDAFKTVVRKLHDMFDYEQAEIVETVEREDEVVAVVRFTAAGRGSDVPVDAQFAHLLSFEQGKLRRLEWFRGRDEAVAALA